MPVFYWIILSTFFISLIAFVGVFTLFLKDKVLNKILLFLVAFSAGGLMGGAFLHLLPEAIEGALENEICISKIFLYLIFGFCTFFILEQFIGWHHHHSMDHPEIMPFSYLILISDGLHNFIDGLIIAGSFVVSFPLGVITSLAVAFHEIPQEIGDFGVLVYGGFNKIKALFLNFVSAITAILGGIIGFFLSERIGEQILLLLPFAAGNFIYIAASDLIPQLKEEKSIKKSFFYFLVFSSGIALMFLLSLFSHSH